MKTYPCQHCGKPKTKGKTESWPTFHARSCSVSCGATVRESKKRGVDVGMLNSVLASFGTGARIEKRDRLVIS